MAVWVTWFIYVMTHSLNLVIVPYSILFLSAQKHFNICVRFWFLFFSTFIFPVFSLGFSSGFLMHWLKMCIKTGVWKQWRRRSRRVQFGVLWIIYYEFSFNFCKLMGLNVSHPGWYLDAVSLTRVNSWKVFLQADSGQELSIPIKIHSVTWQNPKLLNQTGSWL